MTHTVPYTFVIVFASLPKNRTTSLTRKYLLGESTERPTKTSQPSVIPHTPNDLSCRHNPQQYTTRRHHDRTALFTMTFDSITIH